tara:strand:- start:3513 stop:4040 length:528 start_codon:yes stop_codon:yes gene_type:complete
MDKATSDSYIDDPSVVQRTYDSQIEIGLLINTVHSFNLNLDGHWLRRATTAHRGVMDCFYLQQLYGSRFVLIHETLYSRICPSNISQILCYDQIMIESSTILRGYMLEEDELVIKKIQSAGYLDWNTIEYSGDKDKLLDRLVYFHKIIKMVSPSEVRYIHNNGVKIRSFTAITDE